MANSGATAITTSKGPTPPPPVIISNPARPTVIQPFIRPSADELTRAKSKLKSSKKNLVETEREDSNIANQTWREIRKEIPKETLVEIKRILDNLPHEKKQCHDKETFEANKVNFLLYLLNQKEGSELISREKVIKIVNQKFPTIQKGAMTIFIKKTFGDDKEKQEKTMTFVRDNYFEKP